MTSALAPFDMCPCGSEAVYGACCEPLHDGEDAVTAVALMRSRYSAYATDRSAYIFRTWHPRTRPADVVASPGVTWLGLEILRTVDGGPADDTGIVEFRARFRGPDGEQVLHETSRFERRGGRWVYLDGKVS